MTLSPARTHRNWLSLLFFFFFQLSRGQDWQLLGEGMPPCPVLHPSSCGVDFSRPGDGSQEGSSRPLALGIDCIAFISDKALICPTAIPHQCSFHTVHIGWPTVQ